MNTVPISSVWMTCPAAVTKLMLLAFLLVNILGSLQRWRDAQESKNQVLFGFDLPKSLISDHKGGSHWAGGANGS